MYAKTYPALNHVADPAARQRLVHASAPPLIAGTQVNEDLRLLFSARMERQLRQVESQRGIVTRHELLAAVVREHAILTEHAAAQYPTMFAAVVSDNLSYPG
ncbi:unnamed protein product [Phytophthora fragariaefolia]|uniref:Unnamed protein product n=1 Tax=Phytophthora fragariaefolia TaxID=1490495 RepID=A0A9W6TX43_9STRA|nr:unnamed protein product [Phytophthora fragariaefolia]